MARILLAEDDQRLRTLFAMLLTDNGHEVVEFERGDDAASYLADHAALVDLAMVDIVMPGLDGIQVIKRARDSHPALKIIAMSGGAPAFPASAALNMSSMYGADAVLFKPVANDDLLAVVARILSQKP